MEPAVLVALAVREVDFVVSVAHEVDLVASAAREVDLAALAVQDADLVAETAAACAAGSSEKLPA